MSNDEEAAKALANLRELVDWLEEEHGPVTESERAAALKEAEGLDAEHERRRTAQRRSGKTA